MGLKAGGYIVVNEEVCHGKPVFKGTRILVSDVLELLAAGVTVEEIVRDYYPRPERGGCESRAEVGGREGVSLRRRARRGFCLTRTSQGRLRSS